MEYRIKEIRKACGLSQEELAEKSGIGRTTIASLEAHNINRNTSVETLEQIAAVLGCTVAALLKEEHGETPAITVAVKVLGIDAAIKEVQQLEEELKKAKSLADDLALREIT